MANPNEGLKCVNDLLTTVGTIAQNNFKKNGQACFVKLSLDIGCTFEKEKSKSKKKDSKDDFKSMLNIIDKEYIQAMVPLDFSLRFYIPRNNDDPILFDSYSRNINDYAFEVTWKEQQQIIQEYHNQVFDSLFRIKTKKRKLKWKN